MSTITNKTFTRFNATVANLFRQLAGKGRIPDRDHDESAGLFLDLLLGNRTTMIYFGWVSAPPTEKDIEVKVDLFIKGRFGPEYAGAVAKPARRKAS